MVEADDRDSPRSDSSDNEQVASPMLASALTLLVSAQALPGDGRLVQRALAMGESHVCVADEGRVTCGGSNDRHQLGDGYTGYSNLPIAGPTAIGDPGARSPVV